MIVKLSEPLKDFENEPLKNKAGTLIFMREVIFQAINSPTVGEQTGQEQLAADVKYKIFTISNKIQAVDEVDFSIEELSLIKERGGKTLNPLWYGRLHDLLEEPKKKSEDK